MSNNRDFTEEEFRALFAPRPGWGGRLNIWLRGQSYFVKGGFLLIITLVFITHVSRLFYKPIVINKDLAALPMVQSIDHIAVSRDIATNSFVAARFAIAREATIASLSRGQRLFIETNLARTLMPSSSAEFIFLRRDIERLFQDSLNLTPSQNKKWHELAIWLQYK